MSLTKSLIQYGESVTFCFVITNTGNTPLGSPITVKNDDLSFSQSLKTILNPGETTTVTLPGKINGDKRNVATVIANPLQDDGSDIAGISDVEAKDPSTANQFDYVGNVKVENTVYLGDDNGSKCGTDNAVELVKAIYGSRATYCFVVTNTGDVRGRNSGCFVNYSLLHANSDTSLGHRAEERQALVYLRQLWHFGARRVGDQVRCRTNYG
jgi:hypothetical protein